MKAFDTFFCCWSGLEPQGAHFQSTSTQPIYMSPILLTRATNSIYYHAPCSSKINSIGWTVSTTEPYRINVLLVLSPYRIYRYEGINFFVFHSSWNYILRFSSPNLDDVQKHYSTIPPPTYRERNRNKVANMNTSQGTCVTAAIQFLREGIVLYLSLFDPI